MNKIQAKKLANYHSFTKGELYDMLLEALMTYQDDYWKRCNSVNELFTNGYFFNRCVEWLKYSKETKDDKCNYIVTYRVLEGFGKFSKIQLPKKDKIICKNPIHEEPGLFK